MQQQHFSLNIQYLWLCAGGLDIKHVLLTWCLTKILTVLLVTTVMV